MKLTYRDDGESTGLRLLDDGLGGLINLGEDVVLLRTPGRKELLKLWKEFNEDLRSMLHELFCLDYSEVIQRYGLLRFRAGTQEARADQTFGLLSTGIPPKFAHIEKDAIVQALVSMKKLSQMTATGRKRVRVRDDGGVAASVEKLDKAEIPEFFHRLLWQDEDLDKIVRFDQTVESAWAEANALLKEHRDPFDALAGIVDRLALTLDFETRDGSSAKGSRAKYCFVWFSVYLVRRGVWLLPSTVTSRVRSLSPRKLLPISAWLAVPPKHRRAAELLLNFQKGADGTSAQFALNVFIGISLCSDLWDSDGFRYHALLALKEAVQHKPEWALYSSSVNAVYRRLADYHDVDIRGRPEVTLFLAQKRLAKKGILPFAWAFDPRPRNTLQVSRCTGSPVTTVPDVVKNWAAEFRELLPLFEVKHVGSVVECLDTWLIYLMTIPESEIPSSFREVNRERHVSAPRDDERPTYVRFLKAFFAEKARNVAQDAIRRLAAGWVHASKRDGFGKGMSNPFDRSQDKVVPNRQRNASTVRPAMMMSVWEIIVRENRKDDYAFARNADRGRYGVRLRKPGTDEYEDLFWPAEAIAIDVILNSAARNKTARWLDSGEGDEVRVDIDQMREVPNNLPTATRKRREGFLRLVDVVGLEREQALGMYLNTNKTGKPYEVPWIDRQVAAAVVRMRALQEKWNPMSAPVRARDSDISDGYVKEEDFPLTYPLFRDPRNPAQAAVSSERLLAYWKSLLEHCQPLVNEFLGYNYALIRNGRIVFDIHSIRVTVVTNLLENGVDVTVVQALVGHSAWVMTWYYQAKRHARIHEQMQAGFEARKASLDLVAQGDPEAIENAAAAAITPDFVNDHIGVDMLRSHGRTKSAPLEVLSHGICPGGDCDTGGERYMEGKHMAVWRQRACSGCRFRVTGPMFLNGLVNRLNILTWEMKQSAAKSARMNEEIREVEKQSGKPAPALRQARDSEKSLRDKLALEWALELRTIRVCQHLEEQAFKEGKSAMNALIPTSPDFDPSAVKLDFAEVHDLELLHYISKDMAIIPASIMEVPAGSEDTWRRLISQLLRSSNIEDVTYRLPERQAREAYLRFGDLLLAEVGDPSLIQQLIEGALTIDDFPQLAAKRPQIQELLAPASTKPKKGIADA